MPTILYTKERQLLDFLNQFIHRFGFAPTLQETADALGLNSVATIHEHLRNLEAKGFIKMLAGTKRGVEVIDQKLSGHVEKAALDLPVLGFIAAGQPLEPHTDPNLYLSVAPTMIASGKPSYVLQVKGNSLVDVGILDGDYVVIQHQEDARNGEIVVAVLQNGLATLKKIYYEEGRIKLEPANASMSPIYVNEVKIQGKVVGVIRKY